ncbi:putative transcription factor MYB family [Helianthus anomalus]
MHVTYHRHPPSPLSPPTHHTTPIIHPHFNPLPYHHHHHSPPFPLHHTLTPMSTTTAVKRKFPPPCWTRDEALVLIQAYRERWYALHRAFLKNPDWDAVAEKVTTSCPDVTPPKTSAQCRHKMEKLRQRHRAEKLRASSFPGGRFFSSWFYFEAMEAMENGPDDKPAINDHDQTNSEIGTGIPVSEHPGLNPGRGIRFKPSHVQNLVTLAANPTNYNPGRTIPVSSHTYVNTNNWAEHNHNHNQSQEDDTEDGYLVDSGINETRKNYKHSAYTGRMNPPVFSGVPRKFREVDEDGEMWVKVARKSGVSQGRKRGDGGIRDVVASIKLLGDGFMKVEKMKIDMVLEIERMRMETEMKRNQLILDSQKQIVDAFVKGLVETRKLARGETVAEL